MASSPAARLCTFGELLYRHGIYIIILACGLINVASRNSVPAHALGRPLLSESIRVSQHLHELPQPYGYSSTHGTTAQVNVLVTPRTYSELNETS